ncbi:uncharacterized protein B0I36DRAFT_366753 [Microdochium trichocladiopsis]|uniref:Uncharacterized protein n=1 Tax=Microdochium trichocladiopsis TaxID=1682393 RepID=A0A9P8Y106_9PEZI|nr:uncharacterized protein B0I36DRAFT_366753 [Microdochium trichocladiopsis]KAH7024847.1 hypothetical protein B0I36DRAFT_366753 [Microdochium trichocladiopsis]
MWPTSRLHRPFKLDSADEGRVCIRMSYAVSTGQDHIVQFAAVVFLVDGPIHHDNPSASRLRTRLILPQKESSFDLVLPRLIGPDHNHFSWFNCLVHFCSQPQQLEVFDYECLSEEFVLFLIAASTWRRNFHLIKSDAERIAFHDVVNRPSRELNTRLHHLRQDLASLIDDIEKDATKFDLSYDTRFDVGSIGSYRTRNVLESARKDPRAIITGGPVLMAFLMETFNVLNATMGVVAAEDSLREAQAARQLMWLASVYLPLTLVTGIFGMNIEAVELAFAPKTGDGGSAKIMIGSAIY